jgi:selenocysteine lyase/cysteine desulfurase
MDKREFLRSVGAAAVASVFGETVWARHAMLLPELLAQDDEFWASLRRHYEPAPDFVQLENGYYSRMAAPVLEAFVAHVRAVNVESSHYMRTAQADDKLAARRELAVLAGCPVEELIVTRNTTEALDTVIAGFPWRAGDEAVMAAQDYGAMLDQFALVARRHGVVNRIVSLPNDPRSDAELVDLYAAAITERTRLLMVCQVVNITGQVLPVAKIAAMARGKGVRVLVDGAHAFGQLEFTIPELGGDYYGASLHKWLGCPLGAGILWLRKDRIAELWPLFGNQAPDDAIEKLNHTGTHPVHTDLAIRAAIAFHAGIGVRRKQERLRWLQRYWTERARALPNVTLCTPSAPERTCAIATVAVAGLTPAALAEALFTRFRIWTVPIERPGVAGVRVTPHLYTTTAELDALVAALRELAA